MGRPPGSKNKKTIQQELDRAVLRAAEEAYAKVFGPSPTPAPPEQIAAIRAATTEPVKRGRGRPKGSKNKRPIEKEPTEKELLAMGDAIVAEIKAKEIAFSTIQEGVVVAPDPAIAGGLATSGITENEAAAPHAEEGPIGAPVSATGTVDGGFVARPVLFEPASPIPETEKAAASRADEGAVGGTHQPSPAGNPASPIVVVSEHAEQLDLIYKEAYREVEKMRVYFRAKDYILPERLVNKLDAILIATSPGQAQLFAKKAIDSIHMNFLYEWGYKKTIPGPLHAGNAETKARKAEQLADFLEERGEHKNAAQQRAKAADMRIKGGLEQSVSAVQPKAKSE